MLVPIAKVMKERNIYQQLKERGLLVDIDNIGPMILKVKERKSTSPDPLFWRDKRVFITGTAGFAGSHFAEKALELGAQVYGIVRRHAVPMHQNIANIREKIVLVEGDLMEQRRVEEVIKEFSPHIICHYASESFILTSLSEPSRVMSNNACSTINILEAARKHDEELEAIQVACSSEQYGYIKDINEFPIKESNPFRPCTVYAVSKIATEYLAQTYNMICGLPTIITRAFNHEGPRRGLQFFTSVIARQIAKYLVNGQNIIYMENPNSFRDFTHIYDMVNAYMLAIERANRGEPYNICSGYGIMNGDYAKLALRTYSIEGKVKVYVDTNKFRPYEGRRPFLDGFIGDYSKFSGVTGWNPKLTLVDIIRDSVEYFKENPQLMNVSP